MILALTFLALNLGFSVIAVETGASKYTKHAISEEQIVSNATESSCLRNRGFVLDVLKNYLVGSKEVFEVGTGTGDQTVFFCEHLPLVSWQTSDTQFYHPKIEQTLKKAGLPNALRPVTFDVDTDKIDRTYDVIYASNVLHCIPWTSADLLFEKVSSALKLDGLFILYGPFNIANESNIEGIFTSEGNKKFDQKLRNQDPDLGLRELGAVIELANRYAFDFVDKHLHETANNYVLVFKKRSVD